MLEPAWAHSARRAGAAGAFHAETALRRASGARQLRAAPYSAPSALGRRPGHLGLASLGEGAPPPLPKECPKRRLFRSFALCGARAVGPHSSAASESARWQVPGAAMAGESLSVAKLRLRLAGTRGRMYWVVSPGRAANGQWPVSLPRGTLVVTSWCSHLHPSRVLLRFSHLAEQAKAYSANCALDQRTPSQSSFNHSPDVSPIRRRRATCATCAACVNHAKSAKGEKVKMK